MKPVITLIRISDNQKFVFENTFEETEIKGAATLVREIYSEAKGIGDGNVITGQRNPPRTIEITTCSVDCDYDGYNRKLIDAFMLPNEEYRLILNYKGIERWIKGYLEVIDLPIEYVWEPQEFRFSLYCADPFFRSMDEYGKNIANITATFGCPIFSPLGSTAPYVVAGNIVGVYDFTRTVFVPNDGDADTYARIVVKANADVKDFKIEKNAIEYVRVSAGTNTLLSIGDVLEIDCEEQSVQRNGININRLMDRRSTFFSIDRGGVSLTYSAAQGENSVSVSVYYNKLYKGV